MTRSQRRTLLAIVIGSILLVIGLSLVAQIRFP